MTISAPRDANGRTTVMAALNTDGITPVAITADPSVHSLSVSDGTTGTDHGVPAAKRDNNFLPVLMAVSSADGVTPVELYSDSSGNLLIDMN